MKKGIRISVMALIIIALAGTYIVFPGFVKVSSAFIGEYSVSSDGKEMTMQIGVSNSMGYIRKVAVTQQDGGVLYLDCYSAFGGLNGAIGAKDIYTIQLEEDTNVIALYRGANTYEIILEKDIEGNWKRVELGKTLIACGIKEQPPISSKEEVLTETENKYHVLNKESVESDYTKYGNMELEHEDFLNQDGGIGFYYDMECFYFDESYPEVLNETLQGYYDSIRESYCSDSEVYIGDMTEEQNTPYESLLFQYITYVGEDYISLVYNNVSYMGGAHPYSFLDGITINCSTGEMVEVTDFVEESEEEIGEQLQNVLGFDYYDASEWNYYITENSVVFFYYDPHFWDLVETKRVR